MVGCLDLIQGLSETGRCKVHRTDECRGPLGPRSRPCAPPLWRESTFWCTPAGVHPWCTRGERPYSTGVPGEVTPGGVPEDPDCPKAAKNAVFGILGLPLVFIGVIMRLLPRNVPNMSMCGSTKRAPLGARAPEDWARRAQRAVLDLVVGLIWPSARHNPARS